MALRLVEIVLPTDQASAVRAVLDGLPDPVHRREAIDDGQIVIRLVVDAEETGHLVDEVEEHFGRMAGFQLLMLPVEAALPRREAAGSEDGAAPPADRAEFLATGSERVAEAPPSAAPSAKPAAGAEAKKPVVRGLSREELYDDALGMSRVSRVFVAMVVLSSVVAAVGMMRDSVAVIIGAMVIAPLLGPNVALAFATTLGDVALVRRSLAANLLGVAVALIVTVGLGVVLPVDPSVGELAARASVHISDVALALAAGTAGALAVTAAVPTGLVGVMVAVALLPPTAALGLLIGAGAWGDAAGAGLLLATNVVCINLSGVATFLASGIRPRSWWEADRAKRSARIALVIWIVLLLALTGLIVVGFGS